MYAIGSCESNPHVMVLSHPSYNSQQLAICRVKRALMSRCVVEMSHFVARTRQGAARTLNRLKFSPEIYSRVRVGKMSYGSRAYPYTCRRHLSTCRSFLPCQNLCRHSSSFLRVWKTCLRYLCDICATSGEIARHLYDVVRVVYDIFAKLSRVLASCDDTKKCMHVWINII